MEISKKIGYRISEALADKGMMQKELAQRLGVTDNTISYYCSGKRKPTIEQIIQIAEILNVSTDYLLTKSDIKTTNLSIGAICGYTGLSETNVSALMSLANFASGQKKDSVATESDNSQMLIFLRNLQRLADNQAEDTADGAVGLINKLIEAVTEQFVSIMLYYLKYKENVAHKLICDACDPVLYPHFEPDVLENITSKGCAIVDLSVALKYNLASLFDILSNLLAEKVESEVLGNLEDKLKEVINGNSRKDPE